MHRRREPIRAIKQAVERALKAACERTHGESGRRRLHNLLQAIIAAGCGR